MLIRIHIFSYATCMSKSFFLVFICGMKNGHSIQLYDNGQFSYIDHTCNSNAIFLEWLDACSTISFIDRWQYDRIVVTSVVSAPRIHRQKCFYLPVFVLFSFQSNSVYTWPSLSLVHAFPLGQSFD